MKLHWIKKSTIAFTICQSVIAGELKDINEMIDNIDRVTKGLSFFSQVDLNKMNDERCMKISSKISLDCKNLIAFLSKTPSEHRIDEKFQNFFMKWLIVNKTSEEEAHKQLQTLRKFVICTAIIAEPDTDISRNRQAIKFIVERHQEWVCFMAYTQSNPTFLQQLAYASGSVPVDLPQLI